MKKKVLVEGMTSISCIDHIKDALEYIDTVIDISINLEEKLIFIESIKKVDNNLIIKAIDRLGYSVISIEEI